MSKKLTKFIFAFVFQFILLLGFVHMTSAQVTNSPKIDFSVTSSQNAIVKPQNQDALGSLNAHLTPSGMATGVNRDPIDVVFIFDKSGSMGDNGKLSSAKNAMNEAINYFKANASPKDRFAFIPFDSDVVTSKVVNFSPDNVINSLNLIKQYSNSLSATGGTNYTQSFEKAINLFGSSSNNKYIIFMTDGEPTFSKYMETMTYRSGNKYYTQDVLVNYQQYYYSSYLRSYTLNGRDYDDVISEAQAKPSIKSHGISMATKLAEKNIKLFSIGFGNNSDVDMDYLRELSSKTGVSARQANQDNISGIFQDISKDIDTPSIDAEVSVDLSKFDGKVKLVDGSDARLEGNTAIFKTSFSFPINQAALQPVDISFPFSFTDIGTYTFDNIQLNYKNIDGQSVSLKHAPVSIEVKADAPVGFQGTMILNGVSNTVDNLIKISNNSQNTNQFNVVYNLTPNGLVNSQVSGYLNSIRIIQPLPDGVSIILPSTGVSLITYNGKPAAQMTLSQSISYSSGAFNPSQLSATLKLQGDWALSNVKMPIAILQYKDSRFSSQSSETTIPASNQVINLKVRLPEFQDNAYDGDASGIISKIILSTKSIITQSEFPNNYGLNNKPIKDLLFTTDHKGIEVTYFDNEKAYIYFKPDFNFKGKDTGQFYDNGAVVNEFVDIKLSTYVPGKNVKYYYQINDSAWAEVNPEMGVPLTTTGVNTIKVKAEGGFASSDLIVQKTITIQKKITSISIVSDPIEVDVGKSIGFTVNIVPADASNKNLDMSVSNNTIAYLDSNRIYGVSVGDTKLIVKSKDGSNIIIEVPIHVKDPYIALEELKFTETVYKIQVGEKVAVKDILIYNPANATQKNITSVTSSLTDKVEVKNENGQWYIIGKSAGYSTVSAVAEEQKNGSKPSASTIFEVSNSNGNEDNNDDNNGAAGAGRW